MSNAFAPIVRARPCPIFGRPVHLQGRPLDYSPILLLKPFGFRIAPDTLSSIGLRRWPARHYPRLWIQRPSFERRRDFNPPDSRAAQRTLCPCPTPARSAAKATLKSRPSTEWVSPVTRLTFPTCRAHYPGGSRRVHVSIASPLTRPSPFCRRVGIRTSTFEACSDFTHVTARRIAQPPRAAFVTRLRSSRSPDQTARQLPEQSTTLWVEPPSTGETRHRGAPQKSRLSVIPPALARSMGCAFRKI